MCAKYPCNEDTLSLLDQGRHTRPGSEVTALVLCMKSTSSLRVHVYSKFPFWAICTKLVWIDTASKAPVLGSSSGSGDLLNQSQIVSQLVSELVSPSVSELVYPGHSSSPRSSPNSSPPECVPLPPGPGKTEGRKARRSPTISGFGFRVSGFGIRDSGFGFRVLGFGLRVSGLGFWVSGFGLRVSVLGFRVSGFGVSSLEFRVLDFGFRVSGQGCRVAPPEVRKE